MTQPNHNRQITPVLGMTNLTKIGSFDCHILHVTFQFIPEFKKKTHFSYIMTVFEVRILLFVYIYHINKI